MQRVQRSWIATFAWLAGGLLLGGGSAWLFRWAWVNDGWRDLVGWPAAILSAVGALVCFIAIWSASGKARCPRCGVAIATLDPSGQSEPYAPCDHCTALYAINAGTITPVDDTFVAPAPGFRAVLPEQFSWPGGCAVCGAPETRKVAVRGGSSGVAGNVAASTVGLASAGLLGFGFIRTGGGTTFTVEVPHCDAHQDGAAIAVSTGGSPRIVFRSVAYLRRFCERNAVKPTRYD